MDTLNGRILTFIIIKHACDGYCHALFIACVSVFVNIPLEI